MPKAAEAASLLREYAEEIEADLLREYRVDVGDWWRGELSSRRLVVLVRNLSDESSTKRAMADDPWPLMTHLLVSVVNEQRLARADYAAAHGESVKPTLIPRPGEMSAEEEREQVRTVHDALLSMLAPTPENADARERLRREQPQAPTVEIDGPAGG